jgi:hypothetical protein
LANKGETEIYSSSEASDLRDSSTNLDIKGEFSRVVFELGPQGCHIGIRLVDEVGFIFLYGSVALQLFF